MGCGVGWCRWCTGDGGGGAVLCFRRLNSSVALVEGEHIGVFFFSNGSDELMGVVHVLKCFPKLC